VIDLGQAVVGDRLERERRAGIGRAARHCAQERHEPLREARAAAGRPGHRNAHELDDAALVAERVGGLGLVAPQRVAEVVARRQVGRGRTGHLHGLLGAGGQEEQAAERVGCEGPGAGLGQLGQRLPQPLDRPGPRQHRFRQAELEEQLGTARLRRRLLERALQVHDGDVGRPAPRGQRPGLVQPGDDPRVAAARGGQQMHGELLDRGAGVGEHARGTSVAPLALARREVGEHGVAHERVDEAERRLRAQHVGTHERRHRLRAASSDTAASAATTGSSPRSPSTATARATSTAAGEVRASRTPTERDTARGPISRATAAPDASTGTPSATSATSSWRAAARCRASSRDTRRTAPPRRRAQAGAHHDADRRERERPRPDGDRRGVVDHLVEQERVRRRLPSRRVAATSTGTPSKRRTR
jgi:hypothetical protein